MQALDKLEEYITNHFWLPFRKKWQGGPGSVILNAPEEDREQFRKLKSDDVKNFVNNELAAWKGMSEEEGKQDQFRRENRRLMLQFDREIEKHRKFTC